MDEDLIYQQLKDLIREVFGVNEVDLSTEINKLKTVAEDNDRFIELLQSEFKVNMKSFPYYEYFEEDEFILLSLAKRIFKTTRKDNKSLTVKHLIMVINKGEWFEPE